MIGRSDRGWRIDGRGSSLHPEALLFFFFLEGVLNIGKLELKCLLLARCTAMDICWEIALVEKAIYWL